ncbi:MAG TPA: RNase adapter RapZ [Firmicutes bacterium]|nr:RNase adapter RapZ [Bacillota bacterium]
MKLIIITGLSGAGKTQVVKTLEDLGFYCVDNIPAELIPKFAEMYRRVAKPDDKAALVCDLRAGNMFSDFEDSMDQLQELGYDYDLLFLDATNEALIKRYKQTRRMHPSSMGGRIIDGINRERALLSNIKKHANHIIDTTELSPGELKDMIINMYNIDDGAGEMVIHVMSFGFKYGLPLDSDLVFDVRFLPNPFYIPELKEHTGLETCVHDYVMKFDESKEFLGMLTDMIGYLVPKYIKEGKAQLVISVGCTGGHHRSVTFAEEIYNFLRNNNYRTTITHRDIKKGV